MLLKFRCQLTASVKLKLNLEKCTRSPAREQAPSGGGIMSYFAFVGFRLCVLSIVCWSDTSQTVETHLQTCGRLRPDGGLTNRGTEKCLSDTDNCNHLLKNEASSESAIVLIIVSYFDRVWFHSDEGFAAHKSNIKCCPFLKHQRQGHWLKCLHSQGWGHRILVDIQNDNRAGRLASSIHIYGNTQTSDRQRSRNAEKKIYFFHCKNSVEKGKKRSLWFLCSLIFLLSQHVLYV